MSPLATTAALNIPRPRNGSTVLMAAIGLNGWLWVVTALNGKYWIGELAVDGELIQRCADTNCRDRADAMMRLAQLANRKTEG